MHMRVEEGVDDGTYVIRAELPGVDPDKDVEITTANGVVHIQAERRQAEEERQGGAYRSEFRYGTYSRAFSLPAGVNDRGVKATYKDGILEVRFPVERASDLEAKRIRVTSD